MNKNFMIAFVVAAVLVVGVVLVLVKIQPTMEEQKSQFLAGAVREGEPDFDVLTKRIIAENNEDKTWFSPVGTGTIMMNIAGRIRNNSEKVLTGLEIRVSVLDSWDKVVKENTVIIVPTQQKRLEPKGQMDVNVTIEGFKKDDDRARIRWKVTAIKTE